MADPTPEQSVEFVPEPSHADLKRETELWEYLEVMDEAGGGV